MDGSTGMGFMAVFAVSGSVALLAHQLHKRLLSDFMKRIDFELGYGKCQCKRKIRFTSNIEEQLPPEYEKESYESNLDKPCCERIYNGVEGAMPLNRMALYKGIIKSRMLCAKAKYRVSRGRIIPCVHTSM